MKPSEGLILTRYQMCIKDSFSNITCWFRQLSAANFSYMLQWAQWTRQLKSPLPEPPPAAAHPAQSVKRLENGQTWFRF